MNKNLKKVISSVAALTMVASSVAAFAVDFPDVESTASYAQAVQELSALDVISGYDDYIITCVYVWCKLWFIFSS